MNAELRSLIGRLTMAHPDEAAHATARLDAFGEEVEELRDRIDRIEVDQDTLACAVLRVSGRLEERPKDE